MNPNRPWADAVTRDHLIRAILSHKRSDPKMVAISMASAATEEPLPSYVEAAELADHILAQEPIRDSICTHPNCEQHGKSPCEGVDCNGEER